MPAPARTRRTWLHRGRRIALALAASQLVSGPFAVLSGDPRASAQAVTDPRLTLRRFATMEFPTGMQFTPSGNRLFVNERAGRVRIIERGRLLPRPFATVSTTTAAEGGLLGLALHPAFERGHPWVYVFHTLPDGSADRVVRFRAAGNQADMREVIFDGMPAGGYHHGGIVAFGPDGMLYISNGEAHDADRAQNPRILGGKIYRVQPNGRNPSDNPFRAEPTFSYGHRNPFGLAFDPRTGNLWETENGPSDHDEVNLLRRGRNYGWPVVKGKAGDRRFVDPLLDYVRIIVPTMMAFGGDALPPEYRGNLFFGAYADRVIHRVVLTTDRSGVRADRVFARAGEGVVGMTMGPDGLYFTTPSGVFRVSARSAASPSPTPTSPSPSPPASPSPTGSPAEGGSAAPVFAIVGVIAAGLAATIGLLVRRGRRS